MKLRNTVPAILFLGAAGLCAAGEPIDPTVPGKIALSAHPAAPGEAGRVIAHEDGPFDFFPLLLCHGQNTCPQQLVKMRESNMDKPLSQQLHFVKVSIRTLSDGSWVVAHDDTQYIVPFLSSAHKRHSAPPGATVLSRLPANKKILALTGPGGRREYIVYDGSPAQKAGIAAAGRRLRPLSHLPRSQQIVAVTLSTIDSAQFDRYKAQYQEKFDVYRLKDYVAADGDGAFNFMLYFKTDPNPAIVDEIDALGINRRTILESRGNRDAQWVHEHQGSKGGIFFTGRVDSPTALSQLLAQAADYGRQMWAIEVEHNAYTAEVVARVNATPYISEVDAMPYAQQEVFATGCRKTLVGLDSAITMTSRPLGCLKMMGE
ncbi:hypothetical protein [Paludibacterium yongneupense]|uniref:hypothetical protein n=1 Tax=Paludibacterium yongneupense TaxID=400061 RepID=UPI00042371C2|nr:hypothetical protein [Paludibacterium yongneupense]